MNILDRDVTSFVLSFGMMGDALQKNAVLLKLQDKRQMFAVAICPYQPWE
jgi:hypothetical protein